MPNTLTHKASKKHGYFCHEVIVGDSSTCVRQINFFGYSPQISQISRKCSLSHRINHYYFKILYKNSLDLCYVALIIHTCNIIIAHSQKYTYMQHDQKNHDVKKRAEDKAAKEQQTKKTTLDRKNHQQRRENSLF